ncbi:ATP-binding protein [Bacillus cereus]|uniref:ATP-binding protein n=1 Tax=Bacillus cereus TaxID=1396 RepID=UPI00248F480D|nr:ATP-binding protein [Bacillus cereus]
MLLFDPEYMNLLFQLIDICHEKLMSLLTTHINFKNCDEVFQVTKLANTILNCVLHHETVVSTIA